MSSKLPTYSLHRASGNARVWLNGKSHYLGKFGSVESRVKYAELIKQHVTGTLVDPIAPSDAEDTGPTIHVICAAYVLHAQTYYRKNGKVTAEYHCILSAMRPLKELFGDSPAKDFDSVALRLVRQKMIDSNDWCREYINKSIGRVIRIFRHAAEFKLVSASIIPELELVEPLKFGRTKAKDYEPRSEIPAESIAAIKKHTDPMTRDMIDLSLLTGCRGGELVALTGSIIDTSQDVWVAVLKDHKMAHKGKSRALVFGPQSIEILQRYWPKVPSKRLFPVQRRTFTDRIKRACKKAGLPEYTSHWLRHTSATTIRREHTLDAAQGMLGHASAKTTEIYAGLDLSKAIEVAREFG